MLQDNGHQSTAIILWLRDQDWLKIVEVKQDELLKNRPKKDQAKLTGIAFGPAYKVLRKSWKVDISDSLKS
ncbi:Hypothetical predicted protein [Olea europaea subsp. europaea]|uniref:Uncharacterized protein n=1 Tax=Olea europaea subsp. europaea TaxID=158383 RepID=A0A8S0Q1U1_OLEEU|nr:Hypothetical predicted protein [Olea europaea subsp. europaea]